ncbi:MAG: acyl-CoA thioesterase [Coleofasciculus sp. S288]|nr:acyl-CoA thioesterase [Coleofasciculus sp. S288]
MNSETTHPFEVRLPLPVKTYDIDFAGIVSNIVYIRWLEDLRCEILANYLPIEQQLERDFAPVILQTQIEYKKPIKISEKPWGRMWISKMKTLKWVVTAEISVDGSIAATAEQTGCFVNLVNGRPIPIPHELAEIYFEYQQSSQVVFLLN